MSIKYIQESPLRNRAMATEQVTQPINLEKLDCDGMPAGIERSKKKNLLQQSRFNG